MNPGEEFNLKVRVDDKGDTTPYDGRFNRTILLPRGETLIEIELGDIQNGPKGRKLDLSNISALYLFTLLKERNVKWVIREVRLS